MAYADGTRYAGNWEADMRHGHGVLVLFNGDAYKGGWEADEKNGPGLYIYAAKRLLLVGKWLGGSPCAGELKPLDVVSAHGDPLLLSILSDVTTATPSTLLPPLGLIDARSVVLAGAAAAREPPLFDYEDAWAANEVGGRAAALIGTRGTAQTGFTAEFGAGSSVQTGSSADNDLRPSAQQAPLESGGPTANPGTAEAGIGGIAPAVLQQIRDAFSVVDQEGTGVIPSDAAAIQVALASVRLKPEEDDLDRIVEWMRAEQADLDTASGSEAGGITLGAFTAVLIGLLD